MGSKSVVKVAVIALICVVVSGCASGLTASQNRELRSYQEKGLAVEEKSVAGATAAGLIFGGGSWYTGNYGPAVANTLLWPVSIFWDPVSGYNGARTANYYATLEYVREQRNEAMDELDYMLEDGDIDEL
ncbi:MAG: hypothetical protein EA349_01130, partial [Halomonadaceae bacterium]